MDPFHTGARPTLCRLFLRVSAFPLVKYILTRLGPFSYLCLRCRDVCKNLFPGELHEYITDAHGEAGRKV